MYIICYIYVINLSFLNFSYIIDPFLLLWTAFQSTSFLIKLLRITVIIILSQAIEILTLTKEHPCFDRKFSLPWMRLDYTLFISNTFISNVRLKLANAKQRPQAERLLFENYSRSSSTLWSKNDIYSKKQAKEKICL